MIPAPIASLLDNVSKPARYIGGEVNSIAKPSEQVGLRIALAFPDVYEVGMSHLGLKILYKIANDLLHVQAERVFAPWPDMGTAMRERGVPLYGLECYTPLAEFDLVGFTLQYELSYTNILYMLDLGGVPLLTTERGEEHPLIIAGGPCAFNVEPLAPFLDAVVLGEGEEVLLEIIDVLTNSDGMSRRDRLSALGRLKGVYIPSDSCPSYGENEDFSRITGTAAGGISKRVLDRLDVKWMPLAPVVPYLETVHDRVMLEIFRGCTRGCRFCQAGMIYRPVREIPPACLIRAAEEAVQATGYEEVALTSLSTMDYSAIRELLPALVDTLGCQGVNVSLPSLRVDSFSVEMAAEVVKMRKSGLTLAPEAGSQRLRDVINKQVTAEDLLSALRGARSLGFRSAKLYFMIGLPTETYEDLDAMIELVREASRILPVTVSTSSFVPKTHTPFQWEPQLSVYELKNRQYYLRDAFRRLRQVKYNYHDAEVSFLEAVFSRGDRRLAPVLLWAYEKGARFDGWSEWFSYSLWEEAFLACGVDPTYYANRRLAIESALPWEHLSPGLSRDFLLREREAAGLMRYTPDCAIDTCSACGVCPGLSVMPRTAQRREP